MKHTDTRIYGRSMRLIEIAARVVSEMPRGYSFLSDQLRRASASVALNFAEGFNRRSRRERRRYFEIAAGSANEVIAIFDVGDRFGVIAPALRDEGRDVADHVAAMLTRFH